MSPKVVEENQSKLNFVCPANDIANYGGSPSVERRNAETKLNQNYKVLIDNFAKSKENLDKNREIHVKQIFEFFNNFENRLGLFDVKEKDYNSYFAGQEVDIEISQLMTYITYFWQNVNYIESLDDDMRVIALEEPGKVLDTLSNAIELDSIFYKSLCHTANRKYDGNFLTKTQKHLFEFIMYAVGVFLTQMFFMMKQFTFLADYYRKAQDLNKYRKYLKNVFLTFKQTKSRFNGKGNFVEMLETKLIRNIRIIGFNTNTIYQYRNVFRSENNPDMDIVADIFRPSSLHIAAFQTDLEVLKAELNKTPVDLNSKDLEGFAALHCALLGSMDVLEHLLSYEALKINAQSKAGFTALHLATINSSTEAVRVLLSSPKIDVNIACEDGWTALHIAVSMQHLEIVDELLKIQDLNVDAKMFCQITALHIAVKLDDKNLVQMLLERGAKIEATTENGLTAKQIAAKFDCLKAYKAIDQFLDENQIQNFAYNLQTPNTTASMENPVPVPVPANISSPANSDSSTDLKQSDDVQQANVSLAANILEEFSNDEDDVTNTRLLQAVLKGELANIKGIVAAGIDMTKAHKSNKNALDFALINGNLEIFLYFAEELKFDKRPLGCLLFEAAKLGSFDIVRYLIEEKALSLQLKNQENKTLLCIAIEGGNFEIVKYLTEDQCVPVNSTSENCPLCSAIQANNLQMVKYFLGKGLNILGSCDEQRPILFAAKKASVEIFAYLLDKGAAIDIKSNDKGVFDYAAIGGNSKILDYLSKEKLYNLNISIASSGLSVFFQVVRAGKLNDIKYFVEVGKCNVHTKGPLGGTILHEAAFNTHLEVVRYFVEDQDLDVKARDNDSFLPLFYAVQENNLSVVNYFVSERKLGVHLRDKNGRTISHIAALNGHLDVLRYLVEEKKANLNVKDNDGFTPLLISAKNNVALNVTKYLLEQNCDLNTSNAAKPNILHLAAESGNVNLIKTLIEFRNISVNSRDAAGQTPVFYAALAGHLDAVTYLCKCQNIDIDIKDNKGQDVLSAVASKFVTSTQVRSNFPLIEYLFELKCDYFTRKGWEGWKSLHVAAGLGNVEIIKILFESKDSNVNSKNSCGQTPLFNAARAGKFEAVKYLIDCQNADVNIADTNNQTALSEAVYYDHLDVVKLLVERGAKYKNDKNLLSQAKNDVKKYLETLPLL